MNKAADDEGGERKGVRVTTLGPLARVQGCSQRTAREYCKRGLIPEAFKTPGGHWRIRLPVSKETRGVLRRLRGERLFPEKEMEGEWEVDAFETLALARLCEMDVDEFIAAPFVPGLKEPSQDECVSVAPNSDRADEPNKQYAEEMKERATQIRSEIYKRLLSGQSFPGRPTLSDSVCRFWLKEKRRPTVAEVANLMGITHYTFYRRGHKSQEIKRAYDTLCESKRDLPDPDGLDPVQRANRRAKRKTVARVQRDLEDD